MTRVVEAQDLSFCFGAEPLLAKINFSVEQGDFVAVTGSNGAGKSTLLKLLLGELSSQGGQVKLFGQERFSDWKRIGYVPQNNPVSGGSFPATAEEIVRANLYSQIGPFRPVRNHHREKALHALSMVGMRDFAKRMISELSGGQLQRVMVARALAADCELMLLDEPTTGIDAKSTDNLYELLQKLNRGGVTIFMVTHDVNRALGYVSRIFCLEDGTVVELENEQIAYELSHRHKHPK